MFKLNPHILDLDRPDGLDRPDPESLYIPKPKVESMTEDVKLWQADFAIVDDFPSGGQQRTAFLKVQKGEAITGSRVYNLKLPFLELTDVVSSLLTDAVIQAAAVNTHIVVGTVGGLPAMVQIWNGKSRYESAAESHIDLPRPVSYTVEITGDRFVLNAIYNVLDQRFGHEHMPRIKWWYASDGRGPESNTIFLDPLDTKLLPEFYPYLDVSPKAFLQSYLDNPASVLLMAGPPGTGKTTMLRHLISDFKLTAHVVYDEKLLGNDSIFQAFLFEDESDILLVEDADNILLTREKDQNTLMARFLNVSDGLIKLPRKKIIFTTNMDDYSRVDPALLRPGRCFAKIETRELLYDEVVIAAKAAGIPAPTVNKTYSLGELFSTGIPMQTPEEFGFLRKVN